MSPLIPTLRATKDHQIWYFGTAPSPEIREKAIQWSKVRARARGKGELGSLVYMEWSADEDDYDIDDPQDWAKANPALGTRIDPETMRDERAIMSRPTFLAECMGIGSWPGETGFGVISEAAWDATVDLTETRPLEPVVFALDMTSDRSNSVIAVAGGRDDGNIGVELVNYEPGTDWVVGRLEDLNTNWASLGVIVDKVGPAGSLILQLEAAGINVVTPRAFEIAQAAAGFYDAVVKEGVEGPAPCIRRPLDSRLDAAVAGARKRNLNDAWTWARVANIDTTPLMAVSLAKWGYDSLAGIAGQPGTWVL
jgi:hypothetical protein